MRWDSARLLCGESNSTILPSSGSRMPMIRRIVVDLPAPLGPSSPKMPPPGISMDRRFTAVCPEKRLVTDSMRTLAAVM